MIESRLEHHPSRAKSGIRPAALGLVVGALALAFVAAAGCVKKTSGIPRPPQPSMMSQMEADPFARLSELQRQSADYAVLVRSLPGSTPQEDRDRIVQAFNSLTQLLPLVQVGPRGGVFDHQLSVVSDTRVQLAGGSTDLTATPIIDRGLRAVFNALDDAQHVGSVYSEDAALRASLDQLSAKINEFDTARGAMHDMAWAEAFGLSSDAITRMTAIIADRLHGIVATAPSTEASETPVPPTPTPGSPTTTPAEPGPTPAGGPTEPTITPIPAPPPPPPSEPTTAPG